MHKISIAIIDEFPIVSQGLRSIIQPEGDMQIAAVLNDGKTAISQCSSLSPDVILVDLPIHGMNPIESVSRLRNQNEDSKIVVLSVHNEQPFVRSIIEAGVDGFLHKKSPAKEIIAAIRNVALGHRYLDPSMISHLMSGMLNRNGLSSGNGPTNHLNKDLSTREEQVLRLLSNGYSMKEVAYKMQISIKSVDTYKRRSFEKMGLHSRVQLLKTALILGWLSDTEE